MGLGERIKRDWPVRRLLPLLIEVFAVVPAIFFGAEAFARWLGYPGALGSLIAVMVCFVGLMARIIWQHYPDQGPPLLYRGASCTVLILGLMVGMHVATDLAPEQGAYFSGSLFVVAALSLVYQFVWVCRRFPSTAMGLMGKRVD